jgi:hypothetical protein
MIFEPVEFFQGLMSTILVVISFIVALKILSNYFKYKQRQLLLVGLSWIGLVNPWIPDSITFFMVLIMGEKLSLVQTFLIGYVPIPFFIMCWTIAVADFLMTENKNWLIIIMAIILVLAEILLIVFLFTNTDILGYQVAPFQLRFGPYMIIYLFCAVIYAIITGILFSRKAMISDIPRVKLMGKFLLAAFIFYGAGSVVEVTMQITPITILITKSILITSAICFYIGFLMPKSIENRFLKL